MGSVAVASVSLFGQHPGQVRFKIVVEIGTPYQVGNDPEEWACPLAVRPLYNKLHDAHGGSSLQALCLAISLAQEFLNDFRDKGGSLQYETGEEFALESYSFGIAKRL